MGNEKELPLWSVNLKNARKNRWETQEEFGRRFGVTQQAVASWESATNEAPARALAWLMVELGAIHSRVHEDPNYDWTKE